MWELWRIADISLIMTSDPQLGNAGALANLIYIDEGLNLNNATLPINIEYRVANLTATNATIQNNSTVTIDIEQGFSATGTFNASVGSVLNIRP